MENNKNYKDVHELIDSSIQKLNTEKEHLDEHINAQEPNYSMSNGLNEMNELNDKTNELHDLKEKINTLRDVDVEMRYEEFSDLSNEDIIKLEKLTEERIDDLFVELDLQQDFLEEEYRLSVADIDPTSFDKSIGSINEKIEDINSEISNLNNLNNEFEMTKQLNMVEEHTLNESERNLALSLEHRMNNELGVTHPDFKNVLNMNTSERAEYFKQVDDFEEILAERELEMPDGSLQNEKANPYQHSMKIIPAEAVDGSVDIDLLATIEITNGVNGKTHELAVWASDGANNELEPYYVYMNSPRDLDFETSDTYEDALSQNLVDSQLFYIIEPDEELERVISDYHEDVCTDFTFNIPIEEQRMNLHEIIVNEELADILIKSESNLLEKSDLVDFGKLVGNDLKDLDFSFDENLKQSFDNALSNSVVKKDEIPYLKASYDALNIKEPDSFSSNKKPLKQEREQGLER